MEPLAHHDRRMLRVPGMHGHGVHYDGGAQLMITRQRMMFLGAATLCKRRVLPDDNIFYLIMMGWLDRHIRQSRQGHGDSDDERYR